MSDTTSPVEVNLPRTRGRFTTAFLCFVILLLIGSHVELRWRSAEKKEASFDETWEEIISDLTDENISRDDILRIVADYTEIKYTYDDFMKETHKNVEVARRLMNEAKDHEWRVMSQLKKQTRQWQNQAEQWDDQYALNDGVESLFSEYAAEIDRNTADVYRITNTLATIESALTQNDILLEADVPNTYDFPPNPFGSDDTERSEVSEAGSNASEKIGEDDSWSTSDVKPMIGEQNTAGISPVEAGEHSSDAETPHSAETTQANRSSNVSEAEWDHLRTTEDLSETHLVSYGDARDSLAEFLSKSREPVSRNTSLARPGARELCLAPDFAHRVAQTSRAGEDLGETAIFNVYQLMPLLNAEQRERSGLRKAVHWYCSDPESTPEYLGVATYILHITDLAQVHIRLGITPEDEVVEMLHNDMATLFGDGITSETTEGN